MKLLQNAVELGSIEAHYNLGCVHNNGDGLQADKKKAHYHFEKAAMEGHVRARHHLGVLEGREEMITFVQ